MQYIIIAYDGTDAQALERRLAVRKAHIELGNKLREAGRMLYGVAMLNDSEQMCGSVVVVDYDSRAELDQWLAEEPYVTGQVWEKIEVIPAKVGPSFANLKAV